ncbi:hypothetical protein PG985_009909 [Apiospora marii]|uniref:uncharacterized protein n=1 Tax=Apiospora marii TaxID=335849 RepID=UPI00312CC319
MDHTEHTDTTALQGEDTVMNGQDDLLDVFADTLGPLDETLTDLNPVQPVPIFSVNSCDPPSFFLDDAAIHDATTELAPPQEHTTFHDFDATDDNIDADLMLGYGPALSDIIIEPGDDSSGNAVLDWSFLDPPLTNSTLAMELDRSGNESVIDPITGMSLPELPSDHNSSRQLPAVVLDVSEPISDPHRGIVESKQCDRGMPCANCLKRLRDRSENETIGNFKCVPSDFGEHVYLHQALNAVFPFASRYIPWWLPLTPDEQSCVLWADYIAPSMVRTATRSFHRARVLSADYGISHVLAWLHFKPLEPSDLRVKGRGRGRGKARKDPLQQISFFLEDLPKGPLELPRICPATRLYFPPTSWVYASVLILGSEALGPAHRTCPFALMGFSLTISNIFHQQTAGLIRKFQNQSKLIDNLVTIYFLARRANDFKSRLITRQRLVEKSILERYVPILRQISDLRHQLLEAVQLAFNVNLSMAELEILLAASEASEELTDELDSAKKYQRQLIGYWKEIRNMENQLFKVDHAYLQELQQTSTDLESAMNAEGFDMLASYAEQLLEKLLSPSYLTAAFLSILRLDALCRMTTRGSNPDPDADEECPEYDRDVRHLFQVSEKDRARIDKLAHDTEARIHTVAQQTSRLGPMEEETGEMRHSLEPVYVLSSVVKPMCWHRFTHDGTMPFPEWALQIEDAAQRNVDLERYPNYGTGPGLLDTTPAVETLSTILKVMENL